MVSESYLREVPYSIHRTPTPRSNDGIETGYSCHDVLCNAVQFLAVSNIHAQWPCPRRPFAITGLLALTTMNRRKDHIVGLGDDTVSRHPLPWLKKRVKPVAQILISHSVPSSASQHGIGTNSQATRASPAGQRSPPVVSLRQLQPPASSCSDPDGCRSLGDIIRSCIVTILLCTWASMHPNIPSPDERWPRVAIRRAGLLLLALFVPEAVIGWALRQRQAAAKLAEKHEEEGWTITHGFFAIMGGFMEYERNRPVRVLLPHQLESYSLTGNGDFPRVSKSEIEDRSKGDAISKDLVIVQTSWFVTQCIARGIQGLPITELELVTVAFAALNFVIYVLWWHKPLNVQRGVRVYKKRMTESPVDDGDVEATVGGWVAFRDALSDLPAAIVSGPFTDSDAPWLFRVLAWPLFSPVFTMFGENDAVDLEGKRVATFYPAEWVAATKEASIFLMVIITVAFGAIHCIGWSFTFPSSIERTLWRVASLSITGVPIGTFLFALLTNAIETYLLGDPENDSVSRVAGYLLFSLYILGRFALLVLPFLCLRSLPPASAVFHVVHWVSFIPHV